MREMARRWGVRAILLLAGVAVSACSTGGPQSDTPETPRTTTNDPTDTYDKTNPNIEGRLGDLFSAANDTAKGQNLRVNKYLWRGALETLSFLPLESTDPFSGVITTEWGSLSGAENERFKVTVYISDEKLKAETLRVAVFRQVRRGGGWTTAAVQDEVPRRIEDSILTRARQLRIADKKS
ncbi:MAG: DUF3576 domain-containing protein [Alphaproteobacteria bacterium]|nr:MAG: DUF3576 domain-containing protein [Alphaproteobacteria bacterium]